MVKQPIESCYVKSSKRINEMRQVYEMRHLQHLSVQEIISKTGISRSRAYRILSTFAGEYPELAEQMKKKKDEVMPEDYQKLLSEVSTLKAELRLLVHIKYTSSDSSGQQNKNSSMDSFFVQGYHNQRCFAGYFSSFLPRHSQNAVLPMVVAAFGMSKRECPWRSISF